jgi:hypothetical protein
MVFLPNHSLSATMRLPLLCLCLLLATLVTAQTIPDTAASKPVPRARISFKETVHDFGTIAQGEKVSYTFDYTNTGAVPLVLSNVQTTCGCTASQWSRTPLAPGKTGKLSASFDSKGKVGRQNKVITIFSNAANAEERVRIVVNVLPPGMGPPTDSAKKGE